MDFLRSIFNSQVRTQPKEVKAKEEAPSKTALPPVILKTIWSLSNLLRMPKIDDSLTRSHLSEESGGPPPVKVDMSHKNSEGEMSPENHRFTSYSVYPPYPTNPTPIDSRQLKILQNKDENIPFEKVKANLVKIDPNFPYSKAIVELIKAKERGTPYQDLSPDAKLFHQAMNLELIKEHFSDICALANNEGGPDLSSLGANYFEVEVNDTLARGLSFIDKRLIDKQTIEVPIKGADGKFELKQYNIERFNLSGSEKSPDDSNKIDHSQGHPLFLLKPANPDKITPPLVVARGTLLADNGQDGAFASVQADGRKDLSLKWIMGNEELKDKLDELHSEFGPIKVTGHSLGGNIATVMGIAFSSHIDQVMTFSAPHVSKDVYKSYESTPINERASFIHIPVRGDLVPSGGGPRNPGINLEAREMDGEGHTVSGNPTERHLKPFNNRSVEFSAIDKEKEAHKGTRWLNTAGVIVAGRFIQNKGGAKFERLKARLFGREPVLPSGTPPERKEALGELRNRELRQPSKSFELPSLDEFEANPQEALLQLERASPKAIQKKYKNEDADALMRNLINNFGNKMITPALAHKLHLAFPDAPLDGITNENLEQFLQLTHIHEDPFTA